MTNPVDFVHLVALTTLRLTAAGDDLHADRGLSTAMRSLLLHIAREPQTVPHLASERRVSRQHIQRLVNSLTEMGLATAKPNPRHRRSVLIVLTPRGRDVASAIGAVEAPLLARLFSEIDQADLDGAARVLRIVCERLAASAQQSTVSKMDVGT